MPLLHLEKKGRKPHKPKGGKKKGGKGSNKKKCLLREIYLKINSIFNLIFIN